jgi:pimeloyl-ACP methyl ester carboxylesterase
MARWAPLWPFRSDDDNRRQLHFMEPAGVIAEDVSGEANSEVLGWGGIVWSFYADYLRLLRDRAADGMAFAVGYDWRQDLRTLGDYAAEKIRLALEMTGAAKVSLAAHSMGGLVLRAALKSNPDLLTRIARVVFVCQPATGAVMLYRRLFTGLLRGLDGGGGVSDRVFRLIMGNSRAGFVGNMSGLPGPLQLLPTEHFPRDASGSAWNPALDAGVPHKDLYRNPASPPGVIPPNAHPDPAVRADYRDRLEETDDAHVWLNEPILDSSIDVWQIAGDGLPTSVGVRFTASGAVDPHRIPSGDDTVPQLSGTAMRLSDPIRTMVLPNLSHGTACLDPRVLELTGQII